MGALSYVSGVSDAPLLGETIGDNLRRTARRVPDGSALVVRHQDVRLTYREFDETVDQVARGLLAEGHKPGDRIGIWAPNCAEWVLAQYASARIGAILVTVNPAYRTHELLHCLRTTGVRTLLAVRRFRTSDYEAMVEEIRPAAPELRRVVFLDGPDWKALLAAGDTVGQGDLKTRASLLDFDDPINVQFTSGTTGSPKGVTLTHRNILNNGYFIGRGCAYSDADRICIPVPFYHCFGMVLANLAATSHGACMVVPCPHFDAGAVLETVDAEHCTSLYGVPTMFIAEVNHPSFGEHDLTSLRTGIMAGAPCPVDVMRRVMSEMHMSEVTISYGMTETSPASTQTSISDPVDTRVGTVGRVMPHLEIKIVDPASGRIVPRDTPGELCTRGYSVMAGYWGEPEMTARVRDDRGWMHSGDLATIDDHGYVRIVGRLKDMIIRGGENISPREIEEYLHTLDDVRDVQIVGVPDDHLGEELMAWVIRAPGSEITAEDLREACRGRLAHFKVPRYVGFVDEYPMTVTGKVQRHKLREMGANWVDQYTGKRA